MPFADTLCTCKECTHIYMYHVVSFAQLGLEGSYCVGVEITTRTGKTRSECATNETWTRQKRVCMRVAMLQSAQRRIGKKIMQSCRTASRIAASPKRSPAQCARADSQRCCTRHTNDPYRSRALTCVWIASAIVLQPHMRHS